MLEAKQLAPGFAAPEPEGMDHHLYSMHIEKSLPEETPGMFGMPANAEIGYLTNSAEAIFSAFLRWVRLLRRDARNPAFFAEDITAQAGSILHTKGFTMYDI